MKTIKGPAIFLAQFMGAEPPFDSLAGLASWAAGHGYVGVQVLTGNPQFFDLERTAQSVTYCDEVRATCEKAGVTITELSTHLQGQLLAVHPAYDALFDAFAPESLRGKPAERQAWAREQLMLAARASRNLGLSTHVTFSGSLLWPYFYPWAPRPAGLVEEGFAELARRWRPILDAFDEAGVDLAYEVHPSEDLHDGASFERFLEAVDDHPRCHMLYDPSHLVLQGIDYLQYIDLYCERIKLFHVKDAEFRPNGRTGAYGGYLPWIERAGRFRSLGDGQVDFKAVFSKFAQYDYSGWAVVEWECVMKHPEDGAAEGARFVRDHIIRVTERAFDDFAASGTDRAANRALLGLG